MTDRSQVPGLQGRWVTYTNPPVRCTRSCLFRIWAPSATHFGTLVARPLPCRAQGFSGWRVSYHRFSNVGPSVRRRRLPQSATRTMQRGGGFCESAIVQGTGALPRNEDERAKEASKRTLRRTLKTTYILGVDFFMQVITSDFRQSCLFIYSDHVLFPRVLEVGSRSIHNIFYTILHHTECVSSFCPSERSAALDLNVWFYVSSHSHHLGFA